MKEIQIGKTDKRTRRSEISLIVIAIVTTLFFLLFPLFNFLYLKELQSSSEHEVLFITASAVELGGFNPKEIKVEANKTVKLILWGIDARHSFNLPQIGIDKVLPAGEHGEVIISTTFNENKEEYEYKVNGRSFKFNKSKKKKKVKPLILEFKCNRYCSLQHWDMRGKLIIFPPK